MTFYTNLRDGVVTRLLDQYGHTVTLRHFTTSYDADEGSASSVATDTPLNAVSLGRSPQYSNFRGLPHFIQNGVFSQAEDIFLVQAKEGVVPVEGDNIIAGDDISRVIGVRRISPGGVDVVYQVGVAGA